MPRQRRKKQFYATEEERLAARRESQRLSKQRSRRRQAALKFEPSRESVKKIKVQSKPKKKNPKQPIEPVVVNGMEVMFASWEDFLAKTDHAYRRQWAYGKTKIANGNRWGIRYNVPKIKLTAQDVLDILYEERGRCHYCGSLCVEKRPSKPNGAPLPWENVGGRIGSIDHITPRSRGGDNNRENLVWCCLWCNTYPGERIKGSTSNGGFYPEN